jgi:hypothetical protein
MTQIAFKSYMDAKNSQEKKLKVLFVLKCYRKVRSLEDCFFGVFM